MMLGFLFDLSIHAIITSVLVSCCSLPLAVARYVIKKVKNKPHKTAIILT